jgi:hypothetical protein
LKGCRFLWSLGLGRRSPDACLLELRVRIPLDHGCLYLVNVVRCQVQVSAKGRSLVQRSPTERDVSVCDLETSNMRLPRPELGCCAKENKYSKSWETLL